MSFDDEQRNYISTLYYVANKNSRAASDLYAEKYRQYVSPAFFVQQWKRDGHDFGKRGGQRNGLADNGLRVLHKKHNGDLDKMAEESGFSVRTVKDRCEQLSLSYIKTKRQPQGHIDTRLLFRYRRASNTH
ncbi:hypothetical protein HY212_03635 [Candidatus Pacearchaeota archaeon]|nr:hypothetical protein [Candidatus Pacearchaeota archaeon]